jgi:succinoglycan biosynthesis protein ExoA
MPKVSIIVPCYNEEKWILSLLEAIYAQTYPYTDMEVIIADGISTDLTRDKVITFQQAHPDLNIRILDNPKRIIPAALNLALGAAQGEIIIRLDGHSRPYPNYIERSVADLLAELGDNIGGIWEIRPGVDSWIARGIAAAATHPFGVGDAAYRLASKAGQVDTVPFGTYKKSLFAKIGKFDERLQTNEDYEMNTRIRQSGGKIWLDPTIRSVYYARSTFKELAYQYWRYGFWKLRMLKNNPSSIRWRQAIPPLFILGLIFLFLTSPFLFLARSLLLFVILAYILTLLMSSILVSLKQKDPRLMLGVPLAMMIMHFTWGSGFLWSWIKSNK